MNDYKIIIDDIVKSFEDGNSITLDLIKYYDNNEFETEIINLADKAIFDSFRCELPRKRKVIVVVALAVIALKYYDGNLWDHIRDCFVMSYDGEKDNKANGKIRSILQLFKKDYNYSNPESLIAVPLTIAGVTSYWLPSFFNFAFDIYTYNLLLRRQIDDDELEREMLSTFNIIKKNYLNENTDNIDVGNHKTYQLSRYTQSSLKSGDNIIGISNIAATCVRMMINYLNNDYVEIKPYYEKAFTGWKNNINKEKNIREKLLEKGNWSISLKFSGKKVYLVTKTEKIEEQYAPSELEIQILEDCSIKNVIKNFDINNNVIGGFLIESKNIEIECNVLNNISYRIVYHDEVLFDSKNKLYLNNKPLFFDYYGNQIYPNRDYEGPAFILSSSQINESSYRNNNYYITEVFIESSKGLLIDDDYYIFKSWKRKVGIEGYKYPWADIKTNIDNQIYPLYNTAPYINCETTLNKEDIKVYVDGALDDEIVISKIISLDNGVNYYRIEKNYSIGFHKISIYGHDKKIGEYEFIYDNLAFKEVNEEGEELFLNISTSFVKEKQKIELGQSYLNIPCYIHGKGNSVMIINPEVVAFSCDNINWLQNVRFPKYKIHNYLYITGSRDAKVFFYSNKEKIEFVKEKIGDDSGKFKINVSVLDNVQSKNIKIEVLDKGKTYSCILDIATYINLSESKMEYDYLKDIHLFSFDFDTNKKIKFMIYDNSEIIFESNIVSNQEIILKNNLEAFKTYRILISERQSLFKETTLVEIPYFFCKTKDMLRHIFIIEKVEIDCGYGDLSIKSLSGISTTIRINKESIDEKDKFIGSIRRKNGYENELARIGDIFISVSGEFDGSKIWLYLSDEDDELLFYDLSSKKIHFTTEINKYTKKMPVITRCLVSLRKGG